MRFEFPPGSGREADYTPAEWEFMHGFILQKERGEITADECLRQIGHFHDLKVEFPDLDIAPLDPARNGDDPRFGVGTPGERGGRVPPFTKEEAAAMFSFWKADEFDRLKSRILLLAREHGEYHSQMLVGMQLSQRSLIGSATHWLSEKGLIASTGETRISSPTSRRHSFVYELTPEGDRFVSAAP